MTLLGHLRCGPCSTSASCTDTLDVWTTSWQRLSETWADWWQRQARLPDSLLQRLDALAREHEDAGARAQAVFALIRREVTEEEGATVFTAPERAWSERRGSRAALLARALEAAGVRAELVLVSPLENALPYPDPPPSRSWYTYPTVRAQADDTCVWYDVTSGDTEGNYLPPSAQGRPAWRVGG